MNDLKNIRVVLINTAHPGNIGASARAMKNMGLNQLILVQPKDFPSGVAVGRAASATDILESAVVVDSLQAAVADCGLVICASARSRKIPWPMLSPEQTGQKVIKEIGLTNKKAEAIGVAFSFQRYKKLPISKFDFKLNSIFTEKGFL